MASNNKQYHNNNNIINNNNNKVNNNNKSNLKKCQLKFIDPGWDDTNFLLWVGEFTRMQVSILRPFHEIVMSYSLDIQKMLEMTILYTRTAEGQIVLAPRYKVPSRFWD